MNYFYVDCCSELNDTVVEAQQRIRQVPPPLPVEEAIERYLQSSNRLIILVIHPYPTIHIKKKLSPLVIFVNYFSNVSNY